MKENKPSDKTRKKKVLPKENFSGSEDDRPLHERIAERAYGLYQERGQDHGNDLEDWLRAEKIVLSERPHRGGIGFQSRA